LLSPKQPMEMQVEQIETHGYGIAMAGQTIRSGRSGPRSPPGLGPAPPRRAHRPGRRGAWASQIGSENADTAVKRPPAPGQLAKRQPPPAQPSRPWAELEIHSNPVAFC
jgi:hypothetical protein